MSTFTAAKKDQTGTNKTTHEATLCNSGVDTLPATLLKKENAQLHFIMLSVPKNNLQIGHQFSTGKIVQQFAAWHKANHHSK